MRRTTFAIGLVFLAFAVSASALAQTSADTAGKKAPAVQTSESQAGMTPASAVEKLKKVTLASSRRTCGVATGWPRCQRLRAVSIRLR